MIRHAVGDFLGFTIYNRETSDLPGHYVVRAWIVTAAHGGEWPFIFETRWDRPVPAPAGASVWHAAVGCCYATLEEARADLRRHGRTQLLRDFWDDAVIVESWV